MEIQEAKAKLRQSLSAVDGIVGVGVRDNQISTRLVVYVAKMPDAELMRHIPQAVGDFRVVVEEIGHVRPLGR